MSPGVKVNLECPHAECEEYTFSQRAGVTRTVVCHQPENGSCLCVLDPDVGGVCIWYAEVKASQEAKMREGR